MHVSRPNVDMRRFWLPDYEKKLIAELQRQQNSAQFCDTLLQTEGISIPTHSSVIGALSLPLSRRLSSSPTPPAGQKRNLQLHTVKPQTLIKLVGLLYSGVLEVDGAIEQRDVLAAAHSFGLSDLVEGDTFEVKCSQELCKETGSGTADIEKRDMQIQVTPRSFHVSTGTQTVNEDTNGAIERSQHLKTATTCSLRTSCSVPEKNTSKTLSSTSCPANSSACSDGESTHEQSSDCMTSATSSEKITLQLSPSASSNCSRLVEGEVQPSLPGTSTEVANDGPTVEEDVQRTVSETEETINQENKERGSVVQKRLVCKSDDNKKMEKMQEMMEATQISIKVKLRRSRAKEEIWEVVNNIQAPEAPSGVAAVIPESYRGPQALTSDDSEPNGAPSGGLTPVPLQLPRSVEETDEIEKLLEDIMIGLNILPNIEKGRNKSQDRDLSQDGGSCQVQKDSASYCACCEDYENRNGNSSTHKAVHGSGCTVHLSTEPSGASSSFNTTHEKSSTSTWRADSSQISKSPQSSSCPSDNDDSNPQQDPNVLELLPLATENEANLFSMADLQFLPCLSPLDSNNNAPSGNKTSAESPLPSRTWLMDNPISFEFPLNSTGQQQKRSPSKPRATDAVEEKTSSTEPGALSAKSQLDSHTERNMVNEEPPQNARRKCTNSRLNKTSRSLSEDATISFSHCKVSLASNNVLAKERKQLSGTVPGSAAKTDQQTPMTRSRRSDTRSRRDAVARTPIRTRNKSQQTLMTSTPIPDVCKTERKRGRPRKALDVEGSERQTASPILGQTEEAKRKTRKRPREKHSEESPSKKAILRERPSAKKDDNDDTTDDNDSTFPTEKRPRLVSLKEIQELIKRQHLKTRRKKDECEKEHSENTENSEREDDSTVNPVQKAANSQWDKADVTECGDGQNNPAQLSNQPANSPKTPCQADHNVTTSSLENNESSDQSQFCIGVIAEEVTKLSEEMDERQKTSPKLYDNGVTGSASAHQEKASADHTPNVTSSENGREGDTEEPMATDKSAGCSQDDEEEVDVLLHSSPDRASVTTEGHKLVEISPDEEEGEESNEVDVTGSETDA